jgi:hypothetical protein
MHRCIGAVTETPPCSLEYWEQRQPVVGRCMRLEEWLSEDLELPPLSLPPSRRLDRRLDTELECAIAA